MDNLEQESSTQCSEIAINEDISPALNGDEESLPVAEETLKYFNPNAVSSQPFIEKTLYVSNLYFVYFLAATHKKFIEGGCIP